MARDRLHLHSMVVHSVVALVMTAAAAFVLQALGISIGRLGSELWAVLLPGSLLGALAFTVPSILTGIADRDHMYANWHPNHRAKLLLSLVLGALLVGELATLFFGTQPVRLASWLAVAVVLGNAAATLGLASLGLRMTLGRQSLARTSYVPDMYRQPPTNILEAVAAGMAEDAKLIDPLEEVGP